MLKFNGISLTDKTIQKTRKWFSDNAIACIEEAKSGKVYVNDLDYYTKLNEKSSKEYIDGRHDHVFTFLQRAYFIQTGESIPLFSFLSNK